MFDLYHIIVILMSLAAAFFSGLLGIGGGVIIFPVFLYLMPYLGFKVFTVNQITGIAATQAFSAIFFTYLNHRKFGTVNAKLVKSVLPAGITGALIGAVSAKFVPAKILLFLYLVLLVMATVLILIPPAECTNEHESCSFGRPIFTNLLILVGTYVSGSLGFAGAITYIPILNHFCKTPLKIAISTTTLVVLIATAIIFVGKAAVGLVPFDLFIFILIGSAVGATLGSAANKRLPASVLKMILLFVVVALGIRILMTILGA